MTNENAASIFKVDESLCIGCGICIDACPMKILEVQDGLCVMTDPEKCLECGTCERGCPEKAITIKIGAGAKAKATVKTGTAGATESARAKFYPILDKLTEMIQVVNPKQIFTFEGQDITSLNNFEIDNEPSYYRAYTADKIAKLGISSSLFFGIMTADVLILTPSKEYDIPYFVMDWDESEEHIFFICDLMPSDDPGRNNDYLNKYLYEPLEELYMNYTMSIPGLKNSVFYWVRSIHSPYIITGSVEKTKENIEMLANCACDYLKAWIEIWKKAEPQDPNSPQMKLVQERRKNIRALYKENDPGAGSLNKYLGKEMGATAISIIEP